MTDKPRNESPTALNGIKVVDLSRILAGPWSTQTLADLGADVIKIENPKHGDGTRAWGPPFVSGESSAPDAAYYTACNRNKRSITIDFSQSKGAELVRTLCRDADVFVENFKVGGLQKYGLSYDQLKEENPRLIYCSITGFGQTGPYAARPGYDFLIQAMGGLMSITGEPDSVPGGGPVKTGVAICDLFTGMYATVSILAALRYRDRSGAGQHIDCSLLDTQVAMLANQASNWLIGGMSPTRMGNDHPNVVPYKSYATSEGHIIITCGNDGQFQRLCKVLDLPELGQDARFVTNADRIANRQELDDLLSTAIRKFSRSDLLVRLEEVNVPCGPIQTIPEVFDNEQVKSRGLQIDMNRPDGSPVSTVGFPVKLEKTPASYRVAPPAHGEDTASVLRELLGMDDKTFEHYRSRGIV